MKKIKTWLAIVLTILLLICDSTSITTVKAVTQPPAPTLSFTPMTPTNGNVTVTAYYPSTATTKQYRLGSSGTWKNYTGSFLVTSNVYVYIQYKTKTGQWSALGGYNITNIDKTPPTKPIITGSTTLPTNQTLTLSISYSSDSVLKQYKIGSNGVYQSYTTPLSINDNTTIYAKAADNVGNWSLETAYIVNNIDKLSPTTPLLSVDTTSPTNGAVNITISYPNDSTSNQYKIGLNGMWTNYSTALAISNNETIFAKCQDVAGNWSEEGSISITNIDMVSPDTPMITASNDQLTNQNLIISISYSSDSITKQYRLDGMDTWLDYTSAVEVTSNSAIYAKSQDSAGNWSQEAIYTIANIDKLPPSDPIISILTQASTNQSLLVDIAFSDEAVIKQYKIGASGNWLDYTAPFIIDENAVIYSKAADNAGNWSQEVSYSVTNIDKLPPLAPIITISETSSTSQPVFVDISFSEDSTVKQYKVGESSLWLDYTTPILLDRNNTIYALAADNAGNWSQEVSLTINNIDTTAPSAPIITASHTAPTTKPITITIAYSDDSTIKQYKIGESEVWLDYTLPITLNSNNTIYAKSTDSVGNWSPETSFLVTNILPKKQVLGYTLNSSAYNIMVANTGTLTEIANATWSIDGLGNLTGSAPLDQIKYANSNGMKSSLMISNNWDSSIAKAVLENPTNRSNLQNNILNALKTYGYTGVNIDIENIPSSHRSYLTAFMTEIYNLLKPLGYQVTIAVPAKTSDSIYSNYAFDYKTLANYSDYIMLMAYDEHYPGGTPGAIASINWVTNVVNYAVTVVPREKLILGLAAYGYDWTSTSTRAYSINGIYNIANSYGATVVFDSVTKSKYYKYVDSTGVSHTVWFEDADTISYKLDLVNNNNLLGIGIWRLGLENQNYWNMINSKLNY